jgi:hypothetical protein
MTISYINTKPKKVDPLGLDVTLDLYITKEKLEKENSDQKKILSLGLTIVLMLNFFYDNNLTQPVIFISLFLFFIVQYCIFAFYNIDTDTECFIEAWDSKSEVIDDLNYIVLSNHYEVRFFHNNFLSHHKSKAIQAYKRYPPFLNYHYNGKIIKANNDEEFSKIVTTLSNLKDFT